MSVRNYDSIRNQNTHLLGSLSFRWRINKDTIFILFIKEHLMNMGKYMMKSFPITFRMVKIAHTVFVWTILLPCKGSHIVF